MRHRLQLLAWAVVALVSAPLLAAQTELTAAVSSQIIDGCAAHAKGKGQSHAIAVYDDGGYPVALLRMDGNSPGITEFAMQKAAAVAAWRFSTAEMEAAARETPGFANAPNVVTVPGGVPVFSPEGHFLGAVGVSGEAPLDDAACADAGIKAAGLLSSRKAAGSAGEPTPSYLDRRCADLATTPQAPIQQLIDRLDAPDEDTRSAAADDLSCRGAEAGPAVPRMIRLFASKYGEIAANAISAVARLEAVAVPALVEALDDRDVRVRNHTCRALKGIGPAARAALSALKERLGRDGYDRALVEMAIKAIERP